MKAVAITAPLFIVAAGIGLWVAAKEPPPAIPKSRAKVVERAEFDASSERDGAALAAFRPPKRKAIMPPSKPTVSLPGDGVTAVPAKKDSGTLRAEEAPLHQLFVADEPPSAVSWKFREAVHESLRAARPKAAPGMPEPFNLESIECRRRICRIVLNFDDRRTDTSVLQSVFLKGVTDDYPMGFGAFTVPTRVDLEDGRVRTTLYLAREGELTIPAELEQE